MTFEYQITNSTIEPRILQIVPWSNPPFQSDGAHRQDFRSIAVRKRRSYLLRPSGERISKERLKKKRKYRMVVNYEPIFPDIRTAFRKFRSIMEEDEELKVIFPKGIKHLQVSERRSAKNIKEILAPSTFAFHLPETEASESANNFEMSEDLNENGCFPYGKGCVYCALLAKSHGNMVKSISNGRKYKIRQRISCKSKNIV